MSSTTLKLPYKRFVAQVSTGTPRSKSTYLALMAENLEALKACPWREAADVPASLTGHDFTASTQFSDAYDAYKLTGNYDSSAMTEIAYAGMAAYRFTVPASAISGGVSITGVSLPISRDRFEAAGVHVAVALSNSAYPSDDWSVVRGSGALAAPALLTQTAAHLTAGSPASGTADIDLSDVSSGNPPTYLWVYVTLEDYTSHWAKYNAKEQRLYAIEGSAMLVGDSAEVTFGDTVTADSASDEGVKYLVKPIPVRVTHYEGYHRTLRPKICFTALSIVSSYEPVTSESANQLPVKSILLPVATWTIPAGTGELPLDHMLATDGLRIPEGDYIIEAWIDETGDGKFTPGEPYGCSLKLSFSASAQPARIDIELTEVSPSMVRMDLAKVIAGMPPPSARPEPDGNGDVAPYPVSDSAFATLAAATDRGRWNLPWAAIEPTKYPGIDAPAATTLLTRIRVVRDWINDGGNAGVRDFAPGSGSAVLLDCYFDLSVRSVLTEADLLATGSVNDLDFGTINKAYNGLNAPAMTLTRVSYRIIIGDGDVGEYEVDGNNLPIIFLNLFEQSTTQTLTVPDPALVPGSGESGSTLGPNGFEYQDRPTFRWTHDNTLGKAFTNFKLIIYTDASRTNIVYNSGILRAPVRDANGMYEWTAPVYVGMPYTVTETHDGEDVQVQHNVAAQTTYYWLVSMLDAKHTMTNLSASALTPFTFAVPAS